MSWSVSLIGTPAKIVEALKAESARLTGSSKEEFDAALPHLTGLIEQNVSDPPGLVELEANGHATFKDGNKLNSTCAVKLSSFYRKILTALLAAITLAMLSSPALAQCQGGNCRAYSGRPAARAASAPVRFVKAVRQRERFRLLPWRR